MLMGVVELEKQTKATPQMDILFYFGQFKMDFKVFNGYYLSSINLHPDIFNPDRRHT